MLRLFQRTLVALACVGVVNSASAFALMGPFDALFQTTTLGYQWTGDAGGPQNLGEEYRWNIKTIYYGFDESFLNYFGQKGVDAVNEAMGMLNSIPPVSQMSANLTEFPLDTRRVNNQAGALGVMDLKSYAFAAVFSQLGLAPGDRWAWALRSRTTTTTTTNYTVIVRNFDPVTYNPSAYVNGVLYTYLILDPAQTTIPIQSDAVELSVDPLAFRPTSIASIINNGGPSVPTLATGDFLTGITRDDAGGLRYLYRGNNYNFETLSITNGGSNVLNSSPWSPVGTSNNVVNPGSPWTPIGTNSTSTNALALIGNALRPGVDKITFIPVKYDSVFGTFISTTNIVTDTYVTNSALQTQTIQRVLTAPDILFAAQDLGANTATTTIPTFVNNDALNGAVALNGPGTIFGQVIITFSKTGPLLSNVNPGSLDEGTAGRDVVWGLFNGTTNAPYIFPNFLSVLQLEQRAIGAP